MAPSASAHWWGSGLRTVIINITPYSYSNASYMTGMDRAIAGWNNTATKVSISKNTNALGYVRVNVYSDTWYGYFHGDGGSSAYIRLNQRTIGAAATNLTNFVQSVLTHEFGHAWQLDHVPSGTSSIMNEDRPRNSMVLPQSHDVSDVNSYFP